MKVFTLIALLTLTISATSHAAEEVDYKPGGQKWASDWKAFYHNPGSEEDLMTPLVQAGPNMVPVILEAIAHKNMRLRRYAIGALGNLGDSSAVDPLAAIVADKSEEDYFRGDALTSVYKLDRERGTALAKKFAGQGDNLKMMTEAVLKKEPWLLAGLSEEAPAASLPTWLSEVLVGTEPTSIKEFSPWSEKDAAKYEGTYKGDVGGDSSGSVVIKIKKSKSAELPFFVSGSYTLKPAGGEATTLKFDNVSYDGDEGFHGFELRFVKLGKVPGVIIGRVFIRKE